MDENIERNGAVEGELISVIFEKKTRMEMILR